MGNLSAAFLGEYRPKDYIRELKASIYAWSQEEDETVEEYVDRCRHLWNKMNLTTDEEKEDTRHFFIKGLRNNPFLGEMFAEHDTLLDCFTIALKHSKKMRVPFRKNTRALTFQEPVVKDEVSKLKEELSRATHGRIQTDARGTLRSIEKSARRRMVSSSEGAG